MVQAIAPPPPLYCELPRPGQGWFRLRFGGPQLRTREGVCVQDESRVGVLQHIISKQRKFAQLKGYVLQPPVDSILIETSTSESTQLFGERTQFLRDFEQWYTQEIWDVREKKRYLAVVRKAKVRAAAEASLAQAVAERLATHTHGPAQ